MVNDPNHSIPGYNKWELSEESKQFDFDKDVLLNACELNVRKLSIFEDFLNDLKSEEDSL